ncbi:hypothetical protein J437_LFUL014675 [Ladona fulva]|uniref:Uncharacterized protein n=1 Tax=Ladona fulva TaxID=123851 RepID=A0A8K0KPB4_LADFU|nr:hypothetical protein J437_LFUL014675 [Ladona fulva]
MDAMGVQIGRMEKKFLLYTGCFNPFGLPNHTRKAQNILYRVLSWVEVEEKRNYPLLKDLEFEMPVSQKFPSYQLGVSAITSDHLY